MSESTAVNRDPLSSCAATQATLPKELHRHGNAALLAVFSLAILTGCTSYTRQVSPIRSAFYANELDSAAALVARSAEKRPQDGDVLQLEAAMIQLAVGDPSAAERTLREVRDRFDKLEGTRLTEQALAYGTDDQRLAYAGEDYEKILIRAFLALSSLLQDGADAEAYSLQTIGKQEEILQLVHARDSASDSAAPAGSSVPPLIHRVALAPYLRGVLREATHRDYDDAERSYAAVVDWQPEFGPGPHDLQRALHGRHSQPGNGVLYVFALTGRGPYKEEVVQVPSSTSLLIASELVSQFASQTVPPNIAPVKVPQVVARPNVIRAIGVEVNGRPRGMTSTITDVTSLAIEHYANDYPEIVARAVARRVLKKGVVYAAKEVSDVTKGTVASTAIDLAAVAWEATESADTRCWGLLPDRIEVHRVELPVGTHTIGLVPIHAGGPHVGLATQEIIEIRDGRNTYVLAHFPIDRLVGQVLVSQP